MKNKKITSLLLLAAVAFCIIFNQPAKTRKVKTKHLYINNDGYATDTLRLDPGPSFYTYYKVDRITKRI